ncbi:replication factor C small subunit [Candidatus Woesearchaeota archaeon]|nr:MAG: replication factor C small subunit, replication factor C small subunit [archaeon GW2011_AR4]MBS3129166.1 replication factor C small subunit [Candidatus Woesearchaeota archaeon]HIH37899.1 replication factor C small subunit [Candidatus Woesearchaeota archaeon]HIH48892.1 replication factor C small subunit [Candidatus Woesearchaeota archaeon]HIJ04026.1 replication factor C small subunit [Candidatus Woesearchaeota archaeon]
MASTIWTEKYRPVDFSGIKGQKEIVKRCKAFVREKNMPHVLFAGPAGVGKSSLALVIAKQLYGEIWHQSFLELNASDERGIDVIRNKVKDFARTRAMENVPFKIIFLDECDALTREAQQALRRTMENYTQTTRFVLSCNYSSKIIDPIQSRCAVFRFKPLEKSEIFEILDEIIAKEGLSADRQAKEALFIVSEGDCRKMENILQSCAALKKNIDENDIYSIAAVARPKEIGEALSLAMQGKFLEARSALLDVMLKYGLSGLDVVKQIERVIWDLDIPERRKVHLIDKCGEIEFRITEGSDEFLQVQALLANFVVKE